jgi:hypothetical protein
LCGFWIKLQAGTLAKNSSMDISEYMARTKALVPFYFELARAFSQDRDSILFANFVAKRPKSTKFSSAKFAIKFFRLRFMELP